jgi:glycosyltransferase involved in cell wall biosynthesis
VRVAFLDFNFIQYSIRLANGLARRASVLLLVPEASAAPYASHVDPQIALRRFRLPRLRQPFRQARMIAELRRDIREFAPDVLHLQTGHLWFNFALPLFRDYPLILTVHDPRRHLGDRESAKTPEWVLDLPYRYAKRVIVHGEQLRTVVVGDLGVPASIVDVIPPVPDILPASNGVAERAATRRPVILFFGRIWPYKGLEHLIRAEPFISAHIPDVKIVIAGRGEDLERYRGMMANPDRFDVRNYWISDDERDALFQEAAVVVLPYVDASISGVVPVAYTFGKPVIATDVGILAEMVDDGESGFVVPPRDHRTLGEAIVRVLSDDRLWRRLAHGAQMKLASTFDPDVIAVQTLDVYRRALGTPTDAS